MSVSDQSIPVDESPRAGFLSRMISGIYSAYSNLNGATLTGAIDIIVVEHPDGSLHCSPFHVRFGKASVFSTKEKEVDIAVNGECIEGIQMQLGDSGEAFFLEEIEDSEIATIAKQQLEGPQQPQSIERKISEINPTASTNRVIGRKKSVYCKNVQERREEIVSQILEHGKESQDPPQRRKRFTKTRNGNIPQQDSDSSDEDIFTMEISENELAPLKRTHRQRRSGLQSLKSMEKQLNFQINEDIMPRLSLQVCSEVELSDREDSTNKAIRYPETKSDTELDKVETEANDWGWGRLPLMEGEVPLMGTRLQVPTRRPSRRSISRRASTPPQAKSNEEKRITESSGSHAKPALPQASPKTKKISGNVFLDELLPVAELDPEISEKYFGKAKTTGSRKKSRVFPSDIAMSLCGGLVFGSKPGTEAFEQCRVTYDQLCADPSIIDHPSLVVRINGELFSWKAAAPLITSFLIFQRSLPQAIISSVREKHMLLPSSHEATINSNESSPRSLSSWWLWRTNHQSDSGISADETPPTVPSSDATPTPPLTSEYREWLGSHGEILTTVMGRPYRKTLRLNSERLKKLALTPGCNDVEFSVTTSFQGTTRCSCHIYLWRHDDKVVISDIDGTITISDILGHVMPMIGKGWEHSGVANLFDKVAKNGYKFIYLSARAIGQASMTRGYLKSIRQNSLSLPSGPVLLNPTSLLSAFHREVIIKRPQDFKISCLKDVHSLFPTEHKPFFAGFGNRLTDVLSYRAVSIEMSRIFTINPQGQLSQELVASDNQDCIYESNSYEALSHVADTIFPVLHNDDDQLVPN